MLNLRREKFCREYIKDLNATQAGIRAGFSAKTAYAIAGKLLKNDEIQARISELSKSSMEKCEITTEYILRGIKKIAEMCAEPLDYKENPISGKPSHRAAADAQAALRALELLGKYKSLFAQEKKTISIDGSPEGGLHIQIIEDTYSPREKSKIPDDTREQAA